MTVDPRIVKDALPLEVVTYNEICQLAHEGAKVIHPKAVEIVMQKGIPLYIKSAFSDAPGTLVTSINTNTTITRDRTITGIAYSANITQFKILSDGIINKSDFYRIISLAHAGISIDFINGSRQNSIYLTKYSDFSSCTDSESIGITPQLLTGCAKMAVVGVAMTGMPGVMAKIVDTLAQEQITILTIG